MTWIKPLSIAILSLLSIVLSTSLHAQDELQSQIEACAKNTAMEWSSQLNRCVGKVQARQERHDAQACDKLTDIEARKACHMQLATNKTGVTDDPKQAGKKMTDLQSRSMMINTANTIVAAINYVAKDGTSSSCMSKQIFGITALGGFATDLYLKSQTKKKLNSLKDKFIVENTESPYSTQVKALNYLKDEQAVIKDIASQEKKRQMLLMIGYGAAAVTAAYETFYNTACSGGESEKKADGQKTEGNAAGASKDADAAGAGKAADAKPAMPANLTKGIGSFLSSPTGIIILAGIGGVNAGTLYSAAADQEKESEENIKKIEKILASFKDSYANFCPNGREKLEEPTCYCYLENGQQNTNRTNSQICQQLWAKNQYIYDTTAGNYASTGTVDPAGCLTVKNEFDENCKCKKFLNSAGQNACKKGVSINVGDNALGAAFLKSSGFDNVMNNLGQTSNGNPNLNGLNGTQLGLAIAKQKEHKNRLFDKLKNDPKRKDMIKSDSQIEGYSRALFTKANLDAASSLAGGTLLGSAAGSSKLSPEQTKILSEVQKKTGLELAGGSGLNNKKKDKKPGMDFDFMEATASNGQGQVQDFPEAKSYKYKNSDIVTDQGASIFEIISNRYVESGLKRLFEEPGDVETK